MREYRFEKSLEVTIPIQRESTIPLINRLTSFTDGSLTGASLRDLNIADTLPLGKHVTAFQCHAKYCVCLSRFCLSFSRNISLNTLNQLPANQMVHVCTNNQATIKALGGYKFISSLVLESMCTTTVITKKQANLASSLDFVGPDPVIPVSSSTLLRTIPPWKSNITGDYLTMRNANHAKNCIHSFLNEHRYTIEIGNNLTQ